MLVATRSTTTPSVTQHAFINELSLGSLILSTFKVFCPKRADCTHGVLLCRLHTEQDFWADYVAATWQLSCAVCTSARCLVQTARTVSSCADCTRNKIFGQTTWQLRGSFRVQTAQAHGVLCRLHTEQDFGQTTWHRRGIDVATAVHRTLSSCRLQRDSKQFHAREHTVLLPRGH